MKKSSVMVFTGSLLAFAAASLMVVSPSWGQKKPPPPPVKIVGPNLAPLSPSGAQRGVPFELLVTGSSLANPTGISLGIPAKFTIPTEDKNGTDPTKFKARIEIPADAPLGVYPFRVATPGGSSNLRIFCVDDLPGIASNGKNRTKADAQAIPVPSVVTGAIAAETGDIYKITVKAGQRLSFDCLARRLGSPIDAFLTIYDAKSMRELAFDNDSPGCQTDPRISYAFKDAGDYLVEVKDVLNRGGADYTYRLRIGDFPLATAAVPMAAKRGTKAKIGFAGPAVDGVTATEINIPADSTARVVWAAPKGPSGLHGWPVPVLSSDIDETTEQEPNNDAKTPNRILVPGGVTGRFEKPDDADFYIFTAKKGQKLTIEAQTLELYSPSLVYLSVKNGKTLAEIAKSNPQTAHPGDQKIDFTVPDDGDLILEVQHLHFAYGPNETYRVTIGPTVSGFDLTLPSERYDIAPGSVTAVAVQVNRKGYTGAIDLTPTGHPGLSGTATIKAGQNASILIVVAKNDIAMGAYTFGITGKATVDGQAVTQNAEAKAAVAAVMGGLAYPPMNLASTLGLAVKEKAPFSLAIKMDPAEVAIGGKANVTLTVMREAGFDDEIAINPPAGLPATMPAPKLTTIPKDKKEISFPLDVNAKTVAGEYFVMISGRANHMNKEYTASAPPLMLRVTAAAVKK
ncbi:MAG: hypothetical protein EXS16_03375 [Gemmataceae bacterium]|nr:hypothetical protein [Gemmataceae bacterium]